MDEKLATWIKGFNAEHKSLQILDPSWETVQDYCRGGYGNDLIVLEEEHLQALRAGKFVAWSNDEYTCTVCLAPMGGG